MNLRQAIEKILLEWPLAHQQQFKDNDLASFVRDEFPAIVKRIIKTSQYDYSVTASPGAGNWASVPWLSILDKEITDSTQDGYYPVFLFCEDMSGLYLSLNQGTSVLMKKLGRKQAVERFSLFSSELRRNIPELSSWLLTIKLNSSTPLGSSYEVGNIGARYYSAKDLPDNSQLEKDVLELLKIYQRAKVSIKKKDGLKMPDATAVSIQVPIPKPFLLLAGISGTGKTKWVRDQEEPDKGNLEIIPVRPDWHEPSGLLGYVSRISGNPEFVPTSFLHFLVAAWRNAWAASRTLNAAAVNIASMTPFWLCLDEMNLAPVEQYFADYLSVLELRKWSNGIYSCPPLLRISSDLAEPIRLALDIEAGDPLWEAFIAAGGIPLPPNLIVVGTVNMDETTHSFSRKVLDRALTVEFDAVDFTRYGGTLVEGHAGIALPWSGISSVTDAEELELDSTRKLEVVSLLESWNKILAQTAFRIAYRSINEALLIAGSLPEMPIGVVLDWIAMTKLLPRLEGDEDKLGLDRDGAESSYLDTLREDWKARFGNAWEESRSKKKLDFMAARLQRSGYTSFWP
jgi:hypothetical protein